MIYAIVLKCVLFLHVVVAVPLGNENLNKLLIEDNLRMTSPSYVRSEVPTSETHTGHTIFNVPIPDLNVGGRPNIGYPQVPAKRNPPYNSQNNINNEFIVNQIKQPQNQIETKYLRNPYENILTSPQLQQAISSEIYQNINTQTENRHPPDTIQRWQALYQASPTLQKLLSNPSLMQSVFAPKPQKKQFILVYPNGTIGYEDNINAVSNTYPNHIILSSSELKTLSNIEDKNTEDSQSIKIQQHQHKQNIDFNHAVSTIKNNINNNELALRRGLEKSNSQSNVPLNRSGTQNNIDVITDAAVIRKVNDIAAIVTDNTTKDITVSKTPVVNNTENVVYNATNITSSMDNNVSNSSNQIVGDNNVQDSNITQVKDTIITIPDDSKNISSDYIENSTTLVNKNQENSSESKTTSNKVDELINTNKTSQSNIYYIEPINQTSPDNVSNFDSSSTDSSYRINEINNTQYNISTGDTQNSTPTTAGTAGQAIISNTNNESLASQADTTNDHNNTKSEETITSKELSVGENETANKCQYCEVDSVVNDAGALGENEANIKLDGTETLSWVTFNREDTQKLLFGDDSPNIFFIFYNPPEMDTERETKTTTYPNGTVVEEYIEIRKMMDGTTLRTSTTKTYNTSPSVTNTSDNG